MVRAVEMFEEGEAAVVSWDEGSVEVEVVESVTLREFLAYLMLIPLLVGCCWNSIPAQKALSLSVPARIG
jgi:endo-1,4-beta-mannosidase